MSVQRYCPAVPLTVERLNSYVPSGVSSVVNTLQCTDIDLNNDNDLGALTDHMTYLGSSFVESNPTTPPQAFFPPAPAGTKQSVCAIYAGTGAPDDNDGSNGDYYFRSDAGASTHIYFKSNGSWGAVV